MLKGKFIIDRVCKDSEDDFEEFLKIIKISASLLELTSAIT